MLTERSVHRSLPGFLLLALLFAGLAGCGVVDDDNDRLVSIAGDGGSGVKAAKLTDVHFFEFDEGTSEYVVLGNRVAEDDVKRDLYGSLCSKCHAGKADEFKDSIHYKLAGETPRVMFPGGGAHGMIDRACGLPATTGLTNSISDVNLGECARCHASRYLPVMEGMFAQMFGGMGVADPEGQAEQLVNAGLDCLICHAHEYKSHPTEGVIDEMAGTATAEAPSPTITGVARDSHDNGDFNHDGQPDLVIDVDGDGEMDAPLMYDSNGDGQPDARWKTVAQDRGLDAVRSIGKTNEHTCLRCHEHARTGYKRGTLYVEGHDVHAGSKAGVFANAENSCTVCHTAEHHKFVRGHLVGGDLAAADYTPPPPGVAPDPDDPTDLTCAKCHDAKDLSATVHTEKHLAKIACETCHIPWASGITYSLFGHGGHVAFGRNADGRDTKVIAADMYLTHDRADLDADWEAYKARPMLVWFDGGTSFLAQSLAVRGMPNAKITPFKPMANGMVFDRRYFNGETVNNAAGAPYNAYSMYRFYANGMNAEVFSALGMLSMTPDAVRKVTLADFGSTDPDVQTMALMQVFPNLVYFDKGSFGFEHFLVASHTGHDTDSNGIIDAGANFNFDMFGAANDGLRKFMGFNGPMGFPADYEWYPAFTGADDLISMKLPDGSLIKMFMQMKAQQLPAEQQAPFLAAVANYPAYSNVTLGGHGVRPKSEAIGAKSCLECHGNNGALATPTPVGRKQVVDMGPMGKLEMPVYRWVYYNLHKLTDLGLASSSEGVVSSTDDVDIFGDTAYVRLSDTSFVINWFAPNAPGGFRPAHDESALEGTSLTADDLTTKGGEWMPVLEPVTDMKPNYEVLGYQAGELLWD
ncbi:MAG: hypothetical protein ABFS86_06400 [Planctomycetota bacterium]